jgi:hypothetical protein
LESTVGYRILNISPEFRASYVERAGLEGPFFYGGETVLYYDPRVGQYWNPRTDMYLTYDEYRQMTDNA